MQGLVRRGKEIIEGTAVNIFACRDKPDCELDARSLFPRRGDILMRPDHLCEVGTRWERWYFFDVLEIGAGFLLVEFVKVRPLGCAFDGLV